MPVTIGAPVRLTEAQVELTARRVVITFDATYPTNGELVDLSPYLGKVDAAVPLGVTTNGYVVSCDTYVGGTFMLKAHYGNYDAADGPLIEVPNGTNLSAESVTLLVFGRSLG